MDLQHFFSQVVQKHYRQSPIALIDLQHFQDSSNGLLYQMYQVQLVDGSSWIFQAYHDRFETRTIFTWASQLEVSAWVQQRATLLSYLEQQNYPAPRVMRTCQETLTCRLEPWTILMTSFVDGLVDDTSPQTLSLLGAALGQLHRLPLAPFAPSSWWTSMTITHALHQLLEVQTLVPPAYQELHRQFQAVFQSILSHQDLPQTLIHGDCWSPNAICKDAQVTLIDWEFAGVGSALLDLGALLLMSQCDERGDLPQQMQRERVIAPVQGYAQFRPLAAREIMMLPEAIRFSIVWRGALAFARAKEEGWHDGIERLLGRAQRGYTIAEPIAHLAQMLFSQLAETRAF